MTPTFKKMLWALLAVAVIGAGLILLRADAAPEVPTPEATPDVETAAPSEPLPRDDEERRVPAEPQEAPEPVEESPPEADGGGGGGQPTFGEDVSLQDIIRRNSRWNPPRPLRLVVKQSTHRDAAQARARAEEARRRFLAGESAFALIRELSDPPRGVPVDVLRRYESLPPTEASPVLEIEGGFAVLFGTPTSPPDEESE